MIHLKLYLLLASLTLISAAKSSSIKGETIRYGSIIRIKSEQSNHFLHSHKVPIQPEGPLSVTGFWIDDDANSLWSVQQPYSTSRLSQKSYLDPLKCGDSISLIHSLTGGSLQTFQGSTGLTLPEQFVTNSQQPLESNSNWIVECIDNQGDVKFGTKFRLLHVNSNKYLRISKQYFYDQINCGRGCQIMNHLQIHASRDKQPETILSSVGGITFAE